MKDDFYDLLEKLAPLDRSHNSPDMHRAVNSLCSHYVGAEVLEYGQDDKVSYWQVPPFWSCRSATLKDDSGKLLACYRRNPMELFSYSPPTNCSLLGKELKNHIFSDVNRPDRILFHFRNQYRHWDADWGFCIPDEVKQTIVDEQLYHVEIESNFDKKIPMKQAQFFHKGKTNKTIVFVGHFDHPNQVNDGLAGCIAAFEAIKRLQGQKTEYSYLALAAVEIVGSVLFLEHNTSKLDIKEAVFVGFSGIGSELVYQKSYFGNSLNDRAIPHILHQLQGQLPNLFGHRELIGNDENAFDSLGHEIPCGTIMRWPFKEYHTDLDSMEITSRDKIEEVINVILSLVDVHEKNTCFTGRYTGLPCLSNPDLDVYMDMNLVSGLQIDDNNIQQYKDKTLDDSLSGRQVDGVKLNRLMQCILREANSHKDILDLCIQCDVPFELGVGYLMLLQEKSVIDAKR